MLISLRSEIVEELTRWYGHNGTEKIIAKLSVPPAQTTVRVNSLVSNSENLASDLNSRFGYTVRPSIDRFRPAPRPRPSSPPSPYCIFCQRSLFSNLVSQFIWPIFQWDLILGEGSSAFSSTRKDSWPRRHRLFGTSRTSLKFAEYLIFNWYYRLSILL